MAFSNFFNTEHFLKFFAIFTWSTHKMSLECLCICSNVTKVPVTIFLSLTLSPSVTHIIPAPESNSFSFKSDQHQFSLNNINTSSWEKLWELIKWSPEWKWFDLKTNLLSQLVLQRNVCRVVKSTWLPAKIVTYLVSNGRLLCLAFLYVWRFLNRISQDWPLTLTTQLSTSKLSDNPGMEMRMENLYVNIGH